MGAGAGTGFTTGVSADGAGVGGLIPSNIGSLAVNQNLTGRQKGGIPGFFGPIKEPAALPHAKFMVFPGFRSLKDAYAKNDKTAQWAVLRIKHLLTRLRAVLAYSS